MYANCLTSIEFECRLQIARAAAWFFCGWSDVDCLFAYLDTICGSQLADSGLHN